MTLTQSATLSVGTVIALVERWLAIQEQVAADAAVQASYRALLEVVAGGCR